MANILVCDDDREIVDAIEIYLSQDGYKIYKAYEKVSYSRVWRIIRYVC